LAGRRWSFCLFDFFCLWASLGTDTNGVGSVMFSPWSWFFYIRHYPTFVYPLSWNLFISLPRLYQLLPSFRVSYVLCSYCQYFSFFIPLISFLSSDMMKWTKQMTTWTLLIKTVLIWSFWIILTFIRFQLLALVIIMHLEFDGPFTCINSCF